MKKKELYSGIVYDTMRQLGYRDDDFLLSPEIRPLDKKSFIFGPAFTNRGRIIIKKENYQKIDAVRVEMYKEIKPGEVVVLQADDDYCAHAGDITCLIYKKLGSVGFLTDGIVRDSNRIIKNGFPCFCTKTNPIDALDYWGIVEYQKPITLPGLSKRLEIVPGDWIYADADAAMVIPKKIHTKFEKELEKAFEREKRCRDSFMKINSSENVYKTVKLVFEKEGRW